VNIAAPLFETEVAPRFGFADRVLIGTVQDAAVVEWSTMVMASESTMLERLTLLRQRGVTVLICGGFPRRFEPLALQMGIRVITGAVSGAKQAIETIAQGGDVVTIGGCPGRGMQNRRRCGRCDRRR
jgi:predicted Fe-Mo cluster-binding NifX family protein